MEVDRLREEIHEMRVFSNSQIQLLAHACTQLSSLVTAKGEHASASGNRRSSHESLELASLRQSVRTELLAVCKALNAR